MRHGNFLELNTGKENFIQIPFVKATHVNRSLPLESIPILFIIVFIYTFIFAFQLIEEEEFNKFLVKCNLLYTQSKVKEIFAEIDSDGTGSIDFIEALHV